MTFANGLRAAVWVSVMYSWIALLIALVPTLVVTFGTQSRRSHYAVAGLLGGIAGGFGGAAALFLSLWIACPGQNQACNTAQGDMGLLVTFPAGSFLGCIVALLCMRLYSGPSPYRNWAYAISSQLAFWAIMIILFARLMS
jgi:hypothetical protein